MKGVFMRKKRFIFASAALALLLVAYAGFSATEWTKEFTKNGVTVSTRAVEGSGFKEFKGEVLINAPLEKVDAIIQDATGYTSWMSDCLEAAILEEKSPTHLIYYQATKAPWPVSNRDMVLDVTVTKTPDKIVRKMRHSVHAKKPVRSGYVRVPKLDGEWIELRKGEQTYVIYRVKMDMGGSLPASVANTTATKIPYETMLGLRRVATTGK